MSADTGRPVLATESAFFQAVWHLITDFEATLPETLTTPVRVTLAGGVAAALYTTTRLSSDIGALFSHRVLLPAEAMAFYTDADGQRRMVTWDRNYNPILGLLHPCRSGGLGCGHGTSGARPGARLEPGRSRSQQDRAVRRSRSSRYPVLVGLRFADSRRFSQTRDRIAGLLCG